MPCRSRILHPIAAEVLPAHVVDPEDRGSPCAPAAAASSRPARRGSGRAIPVGFGPVPLVGRLIVGSDGLFKFCTEQQIVAACGCPALADMATALVQTVLLPSGQLQDDVALVVCGNR